MCAPHAGANVCTRACGSQRQPQAVFLTHLYLVFFFASSGVPHTPLLCFFETASLTSLGDLARLAVPSFPVLGLHLCTATSMFMGLRDRMQNSCFQDKHFLQVYFNLLGYKEPHADNRLLGARCSRMFHVDILTRKVEGTRGVQE